LKTDLCCRCSFFASYIKLLAQTDLITGGRGCRQLRANARTQTQIQKQHFSDEMFDFILRGK